MKTFRIPLRVVFYREDGDWVAHCLEFDLCGNGTSKQEALSSLSEAIEVQVKESVRHNNPRNLFSPASSEVQEMFFAGKHSVEGHLELRVEQVDPVIFEAAEYREYSETDRGLLTN